MPVEAVLDPRVERVAARAARRAALR